MHSKLRSKPTFEKIYQAKLEEAEERERAAALAAVGGKQGGRGEPVSRWLTGKVGWVRKKGREGGREGGRDVDCKQPYFGRAFLQKSDTATLCNTLQHTAHCNTLQHTATHCNTLQRTATQRIFDKRALD